MNDSGMANFMDASVDALALVRAIRSGDKDEMRAVIGHGNIEVMALCLAVMVANHIPVDDEKDLEWWTREFRARRDDMLPEANLA